ncbi:MAG: hypothetical protein RL324_1617 [Verrucomicrobiota bacterium]
MCHFREGPFSSGNKKAAGGLPRNPGRLVPYPYGVMYYPADYCLFTLAILHLSMREEMKEIYLRRPSYTCIGSQLLRKQPLTFGQYANARSEAQPHSAAADSLSASGTENVTFFTAAGATFGAGLM